MAKKTKKFKPEAEPGESAESADKLKKALDDLAGDGELKDEKPRAAKKKKAKPGPKPKAEARFSDDWVPSKGEKFTADQIEAVERDLEDIVDLTDAETKSAERQLNIMKRRADLAEFSDPIIGGCQLIAFVAAKITKWDGWYLNPEQGDKVVATGAPLARHYAPWMLSPLARLPAFAVTIIELIEHKLDGYKKHKEKTDGKKRNAGRPKEAIPETAD